MTRKNNLQAAPMLIKFVDEEYYNNFINIGELFFGNLARYRNIEEEEENRGIGDKYDGTFNLTKEEMKYNNFTLNIGGNEITSNDLDVNKDDIAMRISTSATIFCCTRLLISDLINEKRKKSFIKDMKKNFLTDNKYKKKIVLIPNYNKFVEDIMKTANKNKRNIFIAPIIYDNNHVRGIKKFRNILNKLEKQKVDSSIMFSKNIIDIVKKIKMEQNMFDFSKQLAFVKDEFFKSQREIRFLIPVDSNSEDYKLYLGNLNDKNAIIFDSIEECLESIDVNISEPQTTEIVINKKE